MIAKATTSNKVTGYMVTYYLSDHYICMNILKTYKEIISILKRSSID